MESCLALAGAMARQWFGVLMQPSEVEDAWVLEGLAAYLEDVFARAAMGQVCVCVFCVCACVIVYTCVCMCGHMCMRYFVHVCVYVCVCECV
jgi:hypothetical protein